MSVIPISANPLANDWLFEDERNKIDEERRKGATRAADDIDYDILEAFSTPAGRRVLEYLWTIYMLQPTFLGAMGMERGTAWGFSREGQNSVIRDLKARMDRALTADKETTNG